MKNKWISRRGSQVGATLSKNKKRSISKERFQSKLMESRLKLDKGKPSSAEKILADIQKNYKLSSNQNAKLQTLLALCYESQAEFEKSFETLKPFETRKKLNELNIETQISTIIQLAIAYKNLGDFEKAESLLEEAFEKENKNENEDLLGDIYTSFARVYKDTGDAKKALEFAEKGLEEFRDLGVWRGMASGYYYVSNALQLEGNIEKSLQNLNFAEKIIGKRPAPLLMGQIYADMSGLHWALNHPRHSVAYAEKSVNFFSYTEHKSHKILAYNNLGVNLILLGDWVRAEEMLKRSLELARKTESEHIAGIYESLGELELLKGELKRAENFLKKGIEFSEETENDWYLIQNLRTYSRCLLAKGEMKEAIQKAQETIKFCKELGALQFVDFVRLVLVEAFLEKDDLEKCENELQPLEFNDPESDLFILGEIKRLRGLLALKNDKKDIALLNFRKGLTIFETKEDPYNTAVLHDLIGDILAETNINKASKHFISASETFRRLGVENLYAKIEEKLENLEEVSEKESKIGLNNDSSASSQMLMQRLAEATASRELLFRELMAVLQQETKARKIIIADLNENNKYYPFITHGYKPNESNKLIEQIQVAINNNDLKNFAKKKNIKAFPLNSPNSKPAILIVFPKYGDLLNSEGDIKPLLRIVKLGMDVCGLREHEKAEQVQNGEKEKVKETPFTSQSLMPGFIHSSPAMTKLVEEVYKIRSSDVTVLVTGESGTGKELVSRAIHTVSLRKDKIFIPFNCTAVPRELAEGHLFGYKKGAFTGATEDSPGVIRSADGGTLFLDEIGDLPLDVQPKLLRFLQEGEVHPLGDRSPVKVDVRVIAATNMNLEKRVRDGLFREDLFYRLNVIRLRVPPLRERRSEIKPIVNYYINHYSSKFNKKDVKISSKTIDLLMVNEWEGNIRQLCNEIQRLVARAEDGEMITPKQLSPEFIQSRSSQPLNPDSTMPIMSHTGSVGTFSVGTQGMTIDEAVSELETQMILDALRRHDGNITRTANELGLTRRGLYMKIKRYKIERAS